MKECRICGVEKPLEEYYKTTAGTKDGKRNECKPCWNVKAMDYYRANKERLKVGKREYHYRVTYGITHAEFIKMQKEAGGCEVCGSTKTVLDHCHDSSLIRGILCNPCNQALGMLKDNPVLIRKLADYMDKHTDKKEKQDDN